MGVNRTNEQDAIALMKKHIQSTWVNTTMGSGCRLVLKDTYGSVIHEQTYLDIFELPEDVEEPTEAERESYYQEWKENLTTESFDKFAGLCEVKYLYFFLYRLYRPDGNNRQYRPQETWPALPPDREPCH